VRKTGFYARIGLNRATGLERLNMAVGPPNPQLVLKTTPPRIPRAVLERSRLSGMRPEFADKPVITVQAAGGYGKTSLLAQWRKEALQSGAVVAWLALDERDTNDRLVLGLVAAMRAGGARPDFGQACVRAAGTDEGSLEGITEWLAEVSDAAVETLLILEDAHALPDSTLNSSIAYLLLNAPANLRIVLSSRKPVALPISALPARGRFAELGANELRFDLTETISLLQARFGRKIDLDSCVRLHELTEGWPLGLQLAISTIERSQDLQQAIAGFSVQSGDVHRYFVESLVDHLPQAMAAFLVHVSFVDALSPSLCEAITGQDDCVDVLAQLRDLTPIFSEGLDGEWSRIHPLARDFLAARFARLPETDRREYHARAARWLAEHGQCEEAARHMLEAGLTDEAYDLIARALHDVLVRGQISLVSDWIERLPRDEILRRTSLRLTVGWMLAQSDRYADAAQLVGSIVEDETADAGDRCESAEICATAAFFSDDIDAMGRIVSSWYDALPTHGILRHVVGVNQLALLTLYRGAPDEARYRYRQLPSDDSSAGGFALGWRDWIIGISYLWEGQVDLAARALRVALARAEDDSGRRSQISVMLATALATAEWERDRTDVAAALLADRLDVLDRSAPPDAIAMGYVTSARVAALVGNEQRALDLLDSLFALGEARGLPRLCIASLVERMRLHVLRGRADLCNVVERRLDTIAGEFLGRAPDLLVPIVELQAGLARAYALVARRDWTGALGRLNELAPAAERLRRGRDGIQIYLLRALAANRCGKDGDKMLDEAVSMARMWGLSRILADTHPDLDRFAKQQRTDAASESRDGDARGARASETPGRPLAATRVRISRGSLLSPKEQEVIRLLATNLSNKQIALAMGVSDETIKWHFKNLFRKLNAGSRSHLLQRARVVGIVD
jgi:LuxR family transcriptional regulator, maltose regulon positive regulatory protein